MENGRVCRNCGTAVTDRFCPHCGQQYREKKDTVRQLVHEFIGSFTNFDSRFFHTVVPLLFRPGRVTRQYLAGKHASQLHPVRLYLFSSFVYFLFFFGCGSGDVAVQHDGKDRQVLDSLRQSSDWVIAPTGISKKKDDKITVASDADSSLNLTVSGVEGLDTLIRDNVTPEQYKEMQAALPRAQRDNFFKRYIISRSLHLYQEGKGSGGPELVRKILSSVVQNIPKTLFILLPLFALLLHLLYIRRRQFNYVDHAVLSLHYFSLVFILLVVAQFVLDRLFHTSAFINLTAAWLAVYLFIAMRRIYGQGVVKTLVKFVFLVAGFFILVTFAFLVNFFISAFVA